jgi:GAF domain-containing protein
MPDPSPSGAARVAFARLTGPDHVLVEANSAWFELFPGRERIGLPLTAAAPEWVAAGILDHLDGVLERGEPGDGGDCLTLAGPAWGGEFDVALEPRRDRVGRVIGVDVLALDVSSPPGLPGLLEQQRHLLEEVAVDGSLTEVLERLVLAIEARSRHGLIASVLLIDGEGRLRHGAAPSLPGFYNEAVDGLTPGPAAGSCGTAAWSGRQVVVTDISSDPSWEAFRDVAGRAGLRSCWSAPVTKASGDLLGTFAMYYRSPREPAAADLEASALFARTAALAIERHRSEAARHRAASDLRFLLDATTVIGEGSGEIDCARRLAGLVVPRLAPICAVDVSDGEGGIIRAAAEVEENPGAGGALASFTPRPDRDHPAARMLSRSADAAVIAVPRLADHAEGAHLELLEGLGASEAVSIPLSAGGRVFGVLSLIGTTDRALEPDAVALAGDLARRVAQTMATIHQSEMRVALVRDLQTDLLPPRLPNFAGIEMASSYHPGAAGLDVGGDFYDAFPLDGERFAVMVGDVSGRGARAASATSMVRFTTRAVAPLTSGAAEAMTAVNAALLRVEDPERFITAVYVEAVGGGGGPLHLDVAVAGHPAPLVRRRSGSVEALRAAGPILGQFDRVVFHTCEVTLDPGDSLVLVTDGILEARRGRAELFGEDGLSAAVAAAGEGAEAIVVAVDEAVGRFATAGSEDDRAVLVLTVTA